MSSAVVCVCVQISHTLTVRCTTRLWPPWV